MTYAGALVVFGSTALRVARSCTGGDSVKVYAKMQAQIIVNVELEIWNIALAKYLRMLVG
jgi:hypothetical protein